MLLHGVHSACSVLLLQKLLMLLLLLSGISQALLRWLDLGVYDGLLEVGLSVAGLLLTGCIQSVLGLVTATTVDSRRTTLFHHFNLMLCVVTLFLDF